MAYKNYNSKILQAAKNPLFEHSVSDPNLNCELSNISCQDKISISAKLADGVVKDVGYQVSGCMLSSGSAEVLAGYLIGKEESSLSSLSEQDYLDLIEVEKENQRINCFLLPYHCLKNSQKNG